MNTKILYNMKIENKKVVELTYELTVDGKVVDRTTEMTGPLDYIHGEHMLLPKFEAELEGLEPESEFAFTLTPEEGYGKYDPKHKFEIPKQSFEIDGKIREDLMQVGKIIPMLNSSGMVVQGLIAAVNDDTVTMDFNHPMAGKTLNFKGKVVSVRDATEKELTEGLHGEFAPKEGGCHGGCGCHHEDGDHECCHGEGHEGGCCHGDGHEGECHCHGEGHEGHEGECHCHGEGHEGECHCHEN